MSRLLLVAFTPDDVPALGGFSSAIALDSFLLTFDGEVPPADAAADAIKSHAEGFTHIAAVSSMQSKDVMGRLAGLLDAAMVTDAIGVQSETQFTRPMVAGSVIATVEVLATPVVVTFRPAGFEKVERTTDKTITAVETVTNRTSASGGAKGGRPDLTQAKRIVSGGRPLKDAETFERIIGGLADKLGGAVGATRAAVDSGIAANELQVGQTGKIVAPDLYIAAGISGSTQHMAGIKDSKVIVAINTDPDAPIMESADYALTADLFTAVPEMTEKV
jgi:electron transfer flavoprotein alpha subunit